MSISYRHAANLHSIDGASRGLAYLLEGLSAESLLDVGAGTGTWLRAASLAGIRDILGVDGVASAGRKIHVDPTLIQTADLRLPLQLGRRFDVALCLEVGEHLPAESAQILVRSLCAHSSRIFFSAAAPQQLGEHHINCQWPDYWQALFNEHGYSCHDEIRFRMWRDTRIEPWYRQNMFLACKAPAVAGNEPRILPLIHPDMEPYMDLRNSPMARQCASLEAGFYSPRHYLTLLRRSLSRRAARLLDRIKSTSPASSRRRA